MTVEEELSDFIMSKYRSLREFALQNHISYSTIFTVIRRGVNNTNWKTISQICDALDISADELASGHVIPRGDSLSWKDKKLIESIYMSSPETKIILAYRAADPGTQAAVLKLLDIAPPATKEKAT